MNHSPPAPTVGHLLERAQRRVDPADAELLLAHAVGRNRAWLYAHRTDEVGAAAAARFVDLMQRREAGEPVAYLCAARGFWTLELRVTPDTLIPRSETELLVELALARLPGGQRLRIADLGTGSGAIALALASERPHAAVVATDASVAALAVARDNAARLGIRNVDFREGDWFQALPETGYDLIASNPPYIASDDPHLAQGDLRFEPAGALSSGADGLDAIRVIVAGAPDYLAAGGWLLLEHGWTQGPAVRGLLRRAGFSEVQTQRDLEDRDRVSLGQWP